MNRIKNYKDLLKKVEKAVVQKDLDLSSGEDLSIGIMNLIGIEEHLFFTAQKTGKKQYLDLLNEIRVMRVELLKGIIKDYEGEQWCLSKHFLAASMRLMEVGTKYLKSGKKTEAWDMFEKSYKLYTLFWGLNLAEAKSVQRTAKSKNEISLIGDKNGEKMSVSVFSKLGNMVNKILDCCRE